jgi:hypothetical protein
LIIAFMVFFAAFLAPPPKMLMQRIIARMAATAAIIGLMYFCKPEAAGATPAAGAVLAAPAASNGVPQLPHTRTASAAFAPHFAQNFDI